MKNLLRGLLFFCLAVYFVGVAHAVNGVEVAIPIEHGQGTLVADTAIPTPLPFKTVSGDFQTMGFGANSANVSNGPFYTDGVLLVKQGNTWGSREITFIGNLRGTIYRRLYLGDGQIWKQQAVAFQAPVENTWWNAWEGSIQNLPDGPVWFVMDIDGRSIMTELRNPNVSPFVRLGKAFNVNGGFPVISTNPPIDITGVFSNLDLNSPTAIPSSIDSLLIGGTRVEKSISKITANDLYIYNRYFADGEYPVAICSFGTCVSDYHGFTVVSATQFARGAVVPSQ